MADELHEVVKLLVARMASHPEEFATGAHRWDWVLTRTLDFCTDEEKAVILDALRPIRLKEAHEYMMDELLNGDARKAESADTSVYDQYRNTVSINRSALGQELRVFNTLSRPQPLFQRMMRALGR